MKAIEKAKTRWQQRVSKAQYKSFDRAA
jgi:hypothetical protein